MIACQTITAATIFADVERIGRFSLMRTSGASLTIGIALPFVSEAAIANVWSRKLSLCLGVNDFIERRVEQLDLLKIVDPDSRSVFLVKHYCYEDVADLKYVYFVLAIANHFQTTWLVSVLTSAIFIIRATTTNWYLSFVAHSGCEASAVASF